MLKENKLVKEMHNKCHRRAFHAIKRNELKAQTHAYKKDPRGEIKLLLLSSLLRKTHTHTLTKTYTHYTYIKTPLRFQFRTHAFIYEVQ